MTKRVSQVDPDGMRLPIKVDLSSNGEFMPRPLGAADVEANRRALVAADANAWRAG